jgi:hypothetical protein
MHLLVLIVISGTVDSTSFHIYLLPSILDGLSLLNRSVAVLLWCMRTGHSHGTEAEIRTWMNDGSTRGDGVAMIVKQALDKIAPVIATTPSHTSSSNNSPGGVYQPSVYVADPSIEPVTNWGASDMLALVAAAMPAALKADLISLQEHAEDSYTSSPMRRALVAELTRTKSLRYHTY